MAAGLPEIDLVAVADSQTAAREASAEETGAKPVADYRELVGQIDAAVVATPTSTHLDVASELMRAGVHVLVEKPIAPSLDESDALVQLAHKHGLVLQVGHVERFNPALVAVRPKVSDPKYIEARRTSGYTFRSTDVGVVMDLMIHDIDIVLSLASSQVERVEALGISVMGNSEDMVNARLHFASGCVASITASRTSYAPERTMQVFTARSFASVDFGSRSAVLVEPNEKILRRDFCVDSLSDEQKQNYRERLFSDLLVQRPVDVKETNAIEQELLDFAGAVADSRRPVVDGADGRDAVAVAEMVLEQVESHAWDGQQLGRQGPLAMPALPLVFGGDRQPAAEGLPLRKAG